MEGLHNDESGKSLEIDVTDGANRLGERGTKAMYQAFAFALLVELLLDGQKEFRLDSLQLESAMPTNPVCDQNFIGMFDIGRPGQQPQMVGQIVVHAGTDFGQQHVTGVKGDAMAVRRDFSFENIVLPFKLPDSTDLQQFRMNGTLEQVQAWFCDFGTNG